MKKDTGSYEFGNFIENDKELDRLIKQANIATEMEKKLFLDCGLEDGMQVVDIACGPGITTSLISDLVPNGTVLGIDINSQLISIAKEQFSDRHNIDFKKSSIYELKPCQSFDFAYSRFLFQHLTSPIVALKNVYNTLKSHGIYCVVDVDDSWLTVSPELNEFKTFTESASFFQSVNGGDRSVGRKLKTYFHKAGFEGVKQFVVPVTSQDIGMKNFLDLTTGFKKEQISHGRSEETNRELKEIYTLLDDPKAWGAVGIFVCVGFKK
tara:strand:+ start:580 stop:1377 length:798 start_codon:yes stop_codon:yes gene_type:complete